LHCCWATSDKRKAVGWTLAAIGVLSTVPLAWIVFGRRKKTPN